MYSQLFFHRYLNDNQLNETIPSSIGNIGLSLESGEIYLCVYLIY